MFFANADRPLGSALLAAFPLPRRSPAEIEALVSRLDRQLHEVRLR